MVGAFWRRAATNRTRSGPRACSADCKGALTTRHQSLEEPHRPGARDARSGRPGSRRDYRRGSIADAAFGVGDRDHLPVPMGHVVP
jgi:hypothetical protein